MNEPCLKVVPVVVPEVVPYSLFLNIFFAYCTPFAC